MTKRLRIGQDIDSKKEVSLDLETLISSRMLVQANSGGGKTRTIKRILEATHGQIQQIVVDPEGEYSSLREKFDYILVGSDGDIPADVRTADLLARKVLELRISVILDLYELSPEDRKLYVKRFVDSLINAPRDTWNEALVVVDEAHIFAPEKEQSMATSSIVALASRGRKRGLCLVAGTQRIAKLHKDVVAECFNKMIGFTHLDLDRKRAASELGFKVNESDIKLRQLGAGEFFAYGPALSKDVLKIQIDPSVTSHDQKLGEKKKAKRTEKPQPTAKVKSILARLADLPQEAKKEAEDKAGLLAQVRSLQKQLSDSKRMNPAPKTPELSKDDLKKIKSEIEASVRKEMQRQFDEQLKKEKVDIKNRVLEALTGIKTPTPTFSVADKAVPRKPTAQIVASKPKTERPVIKDASSAGGAFEDPGKAGRKVLAFLAMSPERQFKREQIGPMTGYAHSSGSFSNTLTTLRKNGLIVGSSQDIQITEAGIQFCADAGLSIETGQAALERWLGDLPGGAKKIYEFLLANKDSSYTTEEIAENTGYSVSGSFNNLISKLNTLNLIQKNPDRSISINQDLMDL